MEITIDGQEYFVWWKHRHPTNYKRSVSKLSAKPLTDADSKQVQKPGHAGKTVTLLYPDYGATTCMIRKAHGDVVGTGHAEVYHKDRFCKAKGREASLRKAVINAGFNPTLVPVFLKHFNLG